MRMLDITQNGSGSQACSSGDPSDGTSSPSAAQTAPATVGKSTVVIALIALGIGMVFGFAMSTVGLR